MNRQMYYYDSPFSSLLNAEQQQIKGLRVKVVLLVVLDAKWKDIFTIGCFIIVNGAIIEIVCM